jgi:patatin-related protein
MTAGDDSAPAHGHGDIDRQELRLAAVFTGGVSLAIWMGGVARELNLLLGQGKQAAGVARQVRACYRELQALTGVKVSLDVLSGTSAGGINAAVLALANVRDKDIGSLRQLWMSDGALSSLLRNPADHPTPSLLHGDARLLAGLRAGLNEVASGGTPPAAAATADTDGDGEVPTDVFITTTYLAGEPSHFVDAYGTLVSDIDHHGLFHFDTDCLRQPAATTQLALAARCSASFPVAFEPGLVPFGGQPDTAHPDMSPVSNATGRQYAADGGLLANRPIAAAVRAVFDRPAAAEVRRVMLYVVPTARPQVPSEERVPPLLGDAVIKDLGALTSQAITADLAGIRAHNDAVRVRLDTCRTLAAMCARIDGDLATADIYRQYVRRVSDSLAGALVDEALRHVPAEKIRLLESGGSGDGQAGGAPLPPGTRAERLRERVAARIAGDLPAEAPISPGDVDGFARLGRRAFDGAKVIALDLVARAYQRHPDADQRRRLASVRGSIHRALPPPPPEALDIREMVRTSLARSEQRLPTAAALADTWAGQQQKRELLMAGWQGLAEAVKDGAGLLASLLDTPARGAGPARPEPVLAYLGNDPAVIASRLAQLHITQTALLPDTRVADQSLELIQVSADTRTLLDSRRYADEKLTGLQLHHFGAFYKYSWRASDWMWGRLDGAGWLVHVLLDPRRLAALASLSGDPAGYTTRLIDALRLIAARDPDHEAAGAPPAAPPDVVAELSFLQDPKAPPRASLPVTATWVAAGVQRLILAEELPFVVTQIDADDDAHASVEQTGDFRATMRDPQAGVQKRLNACQISHEKFAGEMTSPLYRQTLKQAVLLTVAALRDSGAIPRRFKWVLGVVAAEVRAVPAGVLVHLSGLGRGLFRRPRP